MGIIFTPSFLVFQLQEDRYHCLSTGLDFALLKHGFDEERVVLTTPRTQIPETGARLG